MDIHMYIYVIMYICMYVYVYTFIRFVPRYYCIQTLSFWQKFSPYIRQGTIFNENTYIHAQCSK